MRAAVAAACGLMGGALIGCATNSYAGVSLAPSAADPAVQSLAARASAGDRAAKFELAGRLERGEGIDRDLLRAKLLYAEVAAARGGTWVPPSASGNRSAPILVGATEDDLARAARARLGALAQSSELRLRRIVVRGVFDEVADSDDAGNDEAAQACRALTGEFAPLIEPRPLPDCGFKGFRRRGSSRVYTAVTYDEVEENVSSSDRNGDVVVTSALSIWPVPASGDCGVYNAVEFLRNREVVATILVSERTPLDKNCHSSIRAIDFNITYTGE